MWLERTKPLEFTEPETVSEYEVHQGVFSRKHPNNRHEKSQNQGVRQNGLVAAQRQVI